MLPTTLLLPPEPARPPRVVPARDRFVDLLRLGAMALVVLQHWLMPVLSLEGDVLRTANAFAADWVWPVTWLSQVMPLVFFTGGAAAGLSLRRRAGGPSWSARRLHRLAVPVLVLAAVWLPLTPLLTAAGLPAQPVHTAARYTGALLWFLALYSVVTVLAPPLVRLAARSRGADVVALAAGAVLVDLARFGLGAPEELGWANVVLVWVAVHQIGVHYAAGRLWWLRGSWALAVALGGFAVVALAVATGPYPPSMIGMPGDAVSNMGPPTAVLLALAAGQLGLALALRPAALAFAERPGVGAAVDRLGGVVMTAYVWHTPALALVGGVALLGLGLSTPEPFSPAWYLGLPLWLGALSAVLVAALRVLGRVERRPAPPSTAGAARLAAATLLVSGGLLGLTLTGFAPAPGLGAAGPWTATLAVATGLLVLARRPTIDRWRQPRPSADPAPPGPSPAPAATAAATTGA
ncbi:Acyltransferase family protein [Georgenia satyanarayanai]|uniref:Acyltransferase family protein n=1 Tax=Georgenia satyanarayanai TaxID=860221 RepID=A0A2Y9AC36_9MICO|nr:acyltransferase [Georgenia satyanarayanai]PYF99785.1 acyltransferase-like protein [Georgenia satyanarayanai]SSA41765.1 Acyltransferase family protein [Georgenia satyanarayanai]